ncbi:MAG TPA: low affinity iron permease family protein [Acidimicrobiales bacterium]|nr:low affinity iron permease family protein [Acidimicrobiales bacterium]
MESSKFEHRFSRVLQWLDDVTSRAAATAIVAILVVIFLITLTVAGFPGNWEVSFATGAASITLVMLFVIQHTQGRQQIALQLKLDELIRASPQADDLLVHIERADEEELLGREQEQAAHHEALRGSAESEEDAKKKEKPKKS